jgi:putative ABC transport system permease protein
MPYFHRIFQTPMLTNYLKIALRSLLRQKSYSAINIIGLALGMACCLVLALFVQEELSYDTDAPNNNRIYRTVGTIVSPKEGTTTVLPISQFPLAPALKVGFPEVERAVRLNANGNTLLANGATKFLEKRVMYADDGYFQMFPSEFIAGNPQTALSNPANIVLTEELARKYFGTENPLGKTLRSDNGESYTVSGVIKNLPTNRHIRFDALVPMGTLLSRWKRDGIEVNRAWMMFTNQYTYIQLREGSSVQALRAKFPALIDNNMRDLLKRIGITFALDVQPLREIHLHPLTGEIQPQGSITTLRVVGAIALVILVLACINFMNLSTARSTRRAREVGMRKVFGAVRSRLMVQFLSESVVISLIALVLALVLVEIALPLVNRLLETQLSVGYASNASQLLAFVGFALVVGIAAGTYPALVLSNFAPIRVLKGAFMRTTSGAMLRKGLVIAQFTISVALVAVTIVVLRQLDYTQTKNLGFQKEQLLTIALPTDSLFQTRRESMKAALRQIPGIEAVAGAEYVPGDDGNSQNPIKLEGAPMEKHIVVKRFFVDEDFVRTMGLTMAQGRNFNASMPTDASEGFLLNEAAVKALGIGANGKQTLGTRLEWYGDGPERKGALLGVVKDFHFESLHSAISPAVFVMSKSSISRFVVRMNTSDVRRTMAQIEQVWNRFAPNSVFEYSFVDDNFGKLYIAEQRTGRIVTTFAGVAVLIACLGLFGLAAFSAEVRTKEIGIRKVLGSSSWGIVRLLSKDFLQLVVVAIVVATPLAYWAAGKWLQDFAYKIDLSADVFMLSGAVAVAVAFLTVASQAWRAARANPVNALRSE